jgi:hypothetical protein
MASRRRRVRPKPGRGGPSAAGRRLGLSAMYCNYLATGARPVTRNVLSRVAHTLEKSAS